MMMQPDLSRQMKDHNVRIAVPIAHERDAGLSVRSQTHDFSGFDMVVTEVRANRAVGLGNPRERADHNLGLWNALLEELFDHLGKLRDRDIRAQAFHKPRLWSAR